MTLDENEPASVGEAPIGSQGNKVRRSIFISEELEASLARLAAERGTTTNDLICEILAQAVASREVISGEPSE